MLWAQFLFSTCTYASSQVRQPEEDLKVLLCHFHAWDILLSNHALWGIRVERCRMGIGKQPLSLRSILFTYWKDTIYVGMALWVVLKHFSLKRGIESQAALMAPFHTSSSLSPFLTVKFGACCSFGESETVFKTDCSIYNNEDH